MNPAAGERGEMWRRLLWREYREGRAAVVLALVIPALMFQQALLADRAEHYGLYDTLRGAGILCANLVILFWAVARGDGRRKSADFELAHLPIGPIAGLTASFIVPALASALVGAAYGYWFSPQAGFVLAGAIDVMTTYAFGYYFAAVVSRWLAMLIGATTIVFAKLITLSDLRMFTLSTDAMVVTAACGVGAALGLYVFARLIGKKPLAYRQALSLGVMALFGALPGLWSFAPCVLMSMHRSAREMPRSYYRYTNPGSQTYVEAWSGWNGNALSTHVDVFTDPSALHAGRPAHSGEIAGVAKPIGFRDRRFVYLARQYPGSSRVSILVWDTYAGYGAQASKLAEFTARRDALHDAQTSADAVSPDGSHALITLRALMGDGLDNWIVNLKTGRAVVFMPIAQDQDAYSSDMETRWTRDYVLIPAKTPMVVDLRSMSAIPFWIPLPKGGAR